MGRHPLQISHSSLEEAIHAIRQIPGCPIGVVVVLQVFAAATLAYRTTCFRLHHIVVLALALFTLGTLWQHSY